jgi:hypothetical protein
MKGTMMFTREALHRSIRIHCVSLCRGCVNGSRHGKKKRKPGQPWTEAVENCDNCGCALWNFRLDGNPPNLTGETRPC